MPTLNFKKQFVEAIRSGQKQQTIRASRGDGKNPKLGQTLYFYTGLRTTACKKIGEARCHSVSSIVLDWGHAYVDGQILSDIEFERLVKADGFENFESFWSFFIEHYDFPFHGYIIKWTDLKTFDIKKE